MPILSNELKLRVTVELCAARQKGKRRKEDGIQFHSLIFVVEKVWSDRQELALTGLHKKHSKRRKP
jgi:hypothetical protein